MSALTKIERAGFRVFLNGDNLGITPAKDLTLPQQEFLKSHKAEIITELSTYQKIINWLALIGETEQGVIDETIDRCKADPETLSYFLQRADGIAKPH
ncbi:hypothetical protein [Methylobacter sp.]|uniref:hypothetical protein n=1 Tax=Methylobacter sp. TaxID=2051955 RepID=UPI002FDC9632